MNNLKFFQVKGRVYEAESDHGISNLIIEAFDKDVVKGDKLGQAKTNSDGTFEITYSQSDFKDKFAIFESNPDLYIVVKTPDKSEILYSSEKTIRSNAKNYEHFDIAIPKATLLGSKEKAAKDNKQLLQLLIGIAWIDGELEPGEQEFLQGMANEKGLANDPEIKCLLLSDKPVPLEECYGWLQTYLNTEDKDFQELYEAINSLMYSDSELDSQEKELLRELTATDAGNNSSRQLTLQRRFMSMILDSKFLAGVVQMERSSMVSQTALGTGYYARVPYQVLSRFSVSANIKAINNELSKLYLTDNFAPVSQEISAQELTVIGKLPQQLEGTFLRNGPNPQFQPPGLYHWFDGDGMLHAVSISDGRASYRNRYVRTQGFELEQSLGQAVWPGLLNLPRFDAPHGLMMKNPANTSFVWHGGKLLALWEAGAPHIIQLPNLETVGIQTFDNKLASTFTAHPKVDPVTGEMMFYGFAPIAPPYLEYSIVSKEGELKRTVPIDLPVPVMMHDFAITENYTIFLDMPMLFKPMQSITGQLPIKFEPERKSHIGVLPRHGDNRTIRWFEVPSCMVFHTANAYEIGNEIVLVACRMDFCNLLIPFYNESGEIFNFDLETLKLFCWRINLTTGTVKQEVLDDVPSEFPQINNQFLGRKNRYIYTSRVATYMKPKPVFDGLIKYDLETGSSQVHEFGRGRFGGDSAFVPRPGASIEDDGWLLTIVWDAVAKQSELRVVDAQNFTSEPVARVIIPGRVPYGFHATWISQTLVATPS
ncbi:carotenoid oxygenase family protein [Nostoc sp. UHCC 0302]|uniref:carotenoid oxygenase family protein n=1 Tax=Nostoc sp. UHCC 0302 TaxID=3134896 RepID=UPI00311CA4CA